MARDNTAEIVISARDEATAIIGNVATELGTFGGVLSRLATGAGPIGLALAGIGAAAGGITLAGAKIANLVEDLDRMATRTGVDISKLQVLRQTIEENGGSADSLTTALSFLNRAIATQDPLLAKLGITGRDTYSVFMQLATILDASGDAAKKTEVAYQLLGRGSGDLIGSLGQIVSGSAEVEARMRAMGGIVEGEAAESARKLDKELDDLGRSTKALLTNVGTFAVPAATMFVKALNGMLVAAIEFGKAIRDQVLGPLEELNAAAASQGMKSGSVEDRVRRREAGVAWKDESGQMHYGMAIPIEGGAEASATQKKDPLADVTFGKTEESPREKRLKEIMRLLGQTRAEASATLRSLEAIEDAKARAQIEDALKVGPEVPRALDDYNRRLEETASLTGMTTQDLDALVDSIVEIRAEGATLDLSSRVAISEEALDSWVELVENLGIARERASEYLAEWAKAESEEERRSLRVKYGMESEKPYGPELPAGGLPRTTKDVLEDWKTALDSITSSAGILDETFAGVFNALEQGFRTAFAGILSGSMSVGAAVKAIWSGVVDAILAELARISAVAVIKLLAKAVGIPVVSSLSPAPATEAAALTASPATRAASQTTNVFNISAFEARDLVRELVSPSGRLRYATDSVSLVGEY